MIVPKGLIRKFLLLLVIVLAGGVITLGFKVWAQQSALDSFWQKMTEQEQSIARLEDANDNQAAVIDELSQQRNRDAEAVEELIMSISDLAQRDEKTRTRIKSLETSNAQTRAYLNRLVDPSISCVLDPDCSDYQRPADYRPATAGGTDASVPDAD